MTIAKTNTAAAKKTNRNLSALFKECIFGTGILISAKDTNKKRAYPVLLMVIFYELNW